MSNPQQRAREEAQVLVNTALDAVNAANQVLREGHIEASVRLRFLNQARSSLLDALTTLRNH